LRSHFNFEQFQKVLQKIAHETAFEAVKSLNQGDVRIVIHGSRLDTVETDKAKIRFNVSHISYSEEPTRNYEDWWGFDVEEKVYLTSDHCTKISYYAPEGKEKEAAEKITGFIDKIMAEASIKPIPRFSLAKTHGAQRRLPAFAH
jgi:hypothetical protein